MEVIVQDELDAATNRIKHITSEYPEPDDLFRLYGLEWETLAQDTANLIDGAFDERIPMGGTLGDLKKSVGAITMTQIIVVLEALRSKGWLKLPS